MEQEGGTQSIYDVAIICSRLFELYLNPSAGHVPSDFSYDFAAELRARFNLWAAYIGAFATPKASLDARLLAHGDIKDMVIELLIMIQANMRHALELNDMSKSVSEHVNSETSLLPGLNAVETALGRLHSIAIAIRRSAARSHRQKMNLDSLGQDEGLCYMDLVKRRFPDAKESLVDQLGTSMHFRGRSMYYQQRHNRKIAEKRERKGTVIQADIEQVSEDTKPETSMAIDTPKRSPNAHALMSETNASVLDRQDLLSRLHNAKPSYSIISKGSSIRESQDNRFDYPRVPKAKENLSDVFCPLCSEPLESSSLTLKTWRDHVDRDIEPYVCISEECKEPLQFFVHHRDWKEHMQRMHTLDWPLVVHTTTWYCDLDHPREDFDRKDNFMQHLSANHTLTRPQILARTRRNKLVSTRESFVCPLCDDRPEDVTLHITEKPYDLLFSHIAQHLKSLAFFSLTYLDFDGATSEESPSLQKDGAEISNASRRSSSNDSFDGMPSTEIVESGVRVDSPEALENGEIRVDTHIFLEPPESEEPAWYRVPRQSYPERDEALEAFAAAMSNETSSSGEEKEKESLGAQIMTFSQRSVFDRRDFLPDGCIETLITEDAVMKEFGITPEAKEVRDYRRLLNFILKEGRKIFAILLVSRFKGDDLQKAITQFRRNKIGDASLPITEETKMNVPFFNPPKKPTWDSTSIRTFCNEQWLFLAPVFSSERLNLELDANDILPFTGQDSDVKSGAFGKVYQVTVHPQHYTEPILTFDGQRANVAIKEINQVHTDDEQKLRMLEEEWKREVKAHIDINQLNHPNIIEFIAAVTRGKRYLMFRWADGGNLREFWQTHKKPQLSISLVRDVVMQLRGLADALDQLHGYGGGGGSYRHGDVKPDNILRVRSKPVSHAEIDVGILKIADMGLAKHHTVVTEFRPPTSMRYTTYRYEPPEFIDGISANPERSRRQDIWSLGCVALELIIWLLYGAEVLNEFNDKWIVGDMGEPSPYFEIEGNGSHRTAKVHPAVDATMDALSRDQECRVGQDSAVKDLLRIVRNKLLVVNLGAATMMGIGGSSTPPNNSTIPVGSRASARDLCLDLDDIIGKGEKKESYWYTGKPRSHIQRLQIGRSRGSDSLLPPNPSGW